MLTCLAIALATGGLLLGSIGIAACMLSSEISRAEERCRAPYLVTPTLGRPDWFAVR